MPIKKENKKLYPKNWKEIRQNILKRAGNKCEFCGVENYAIGVRDNDGIFHKINPETSDEYYYVEVENLKKIKIILTIAHLDHNPQNCDPLNLRALCQKCHNNYDKEHRIETRRKTKENRHGQAKLFNER
ncbi:MAG: hypothetical protein LUE64_06010 [Candidatus Gastranaerophilales bacterium]|nr:hypothetical protein [Candidatus Gastranaerophilales bacterium]